MNKFHFMRQSSGMSYIQILLASSVIAGLAIVGLKMMENQERMARATAIRFESSYLVREISHLLQDPNNCKASLEGLNPSSSVRKINAIKKELRGGKHKEASYYLKYFTFGSSNKLYGQNNIRILNYRLSDLSNTVDVSKGSTNLEVSLQNVYKDEVSKVTVKHIPLKITTSETNKIETCEFFDLSGQIQRTANSNNLNLGKALHIGGRKFGVNLSVTGDISLLARKGKRPGCESNNFGSLIYDEVKDDLLYCSNNQTWTTLGALTTQTKGAVYRVNAMDKKMAQMSTKGHRFCIIKEIKSNEKGSCQVKQSSIGINTRNWKILAEFASPRGGQYCEVECFN